MDPNGPIRQEHEEEGHLVQVQDRENAIAITLLARPACAPPHARPMFPVHEHDRSDPADAGREAGLARSPDGTGDRVRIATRRRLGHLHADFDGSNLCAVTTHSANDGSVA